MKTLRRIVPITLALLSLSAPLRAEDNPALARLDALTRSIEGQLAGADDKQLYLFVDKPLYHPEEAIWFRAFELGRRTLTGTPGEHAVTFELIDPRGAKTMEKRVLSHQGMATNDFVLPAGLVGGTYVLRATSATGVKEERSLTVSTYETPRVKKTVDFGRASYAPGERVTATIGLTWTTGEALAAGPGLTAVINVDGIELARLTPAIDAKGHAYLAFELPRRMTRGDVLIAFQVNAGGVTETIQRRVPVTLDDVEVGVFPEGGDLVVGLPSRVYLAGHDGQGRPAEMAGVVVDDTGRLVSTFKSVHDGMARIALTPVEGRTYAIRLTSPAHERAFALPTARPDGCTLETEDDLTSEHPEIRARVRCSSPTKVLATAVLRDRLLARTTADVVAGKATDLVLPAAEAHGAVRVTLWTPDAKPLAERLVYRGRGTDMKVTVTADKASYLPRDRVTLTVHATDASGAPVKADVALAVVDDAVLNLADDKSANILAALYLLPEMPGQHIHEPNFYFSADKKAPEAMDLLLGTQGWRRFAWKWVPAGASAIARP